MSPIKCVNYGASVHKMIIFPPEGASFRKCGLCKNPFVYDGFSDNCLWCEISKSEFCKICKNEQVACVCMSEDEK